MTQVDSESEQRFFARERTDTVRFVINDTVDFEREDGSRQEGAVISIHALEPEASFLIEALSEPFGDVVVQQSRLILVE